MHRAFVSALVVSLVVQVPAAAGRDFSDLASLLAEVHALEQQVTRLEGVRGAYHPALLEPLSGLARAQFLAGRDADALRSLERALAIVRREGGLRDPRQEEFLVRLAELESRNGAAKRAQERVGLLASIATSDDPEQWARLAAIQVEYGEFEGARELYRRVIHALRKKSDADPLPLIAALRGLAHTYTWQLLSWGIVAGTHDMHRYKGPVARESRFDVENGTFHVNVLRELRREGASALVDAVSLATGHNIDPLIRAAVLIHAGDWFQIADQPDRARDYYRKAADILARVTNVPDTPELTLHEPVQLLMPIPPSALRHRKLSPDDVTERISVIEFEVRADGVTRAHDVVESDVTHAMDEETIAALFAGRYRPRFEGGEPVATTGVRHRQSFRGLK